MENIDKIIKDSLLKSTDVISKIANDETFQRLIKEVSKICVKSLEKGNKIILAGNGGSAADAQHIAGELVSRFMFDRPGLPSIALTTDTSILTAIGNDYGYEKIFSRQIQANGNSGDIFFAYSTSGTSKNIIEALKEAKNKNIKTVGLTGMSKKSGDMSNYCNYLLRVPSSSTPYIQEGHLVIGHLICALIEQEIFG